MRAYYLWLIPCFQVALITAAGDESEHVHIKVHVSDGARKHRFRPHPHQRHNKPQHPILQQFHPHPHSHPSSLPHPHRNTKGPSSSTIITHSSSPPYEFDSFSLDELNAGVQNLMPGEFMDGGKGGGAGIGTENFGPVLFNNDISASTLNTHENHQNPMMSKKLMRQLFTPEMMSLLTGNEDAPHELNDFNSRLSGMNEDSSINRRPETYISTSTSALPGSELFTEYLQHLNKQQEEEEEERGQKLSNRISNKLQTNVYSEINNQKSIPQYRHHQQQQQQQQQYQPEEEEQEEENEEQINFKPYNPLKSNSQFPTTTTQRKQQMSDSHFPQISNPALHWMYGDVDVDNNSDEFETAEEDIPSTSRDSYEDMATAFNKQQPISYQDMFGAYGAPLTSSTAQQGQNYHQQQQQATEPDYTNWHQYYYHQNSEPEPEMQQHYFPKHKQKEQPRQQRQRQKKQKSQKTQFVLPSTTLLLATSKSSSPSPPSSSLFLSSSFSSSSATSPISSGFSSGPITSEGTLPWIMPYEFVQKSHQQQQQQLRGRQREEQRKLDAHQYQHKLLKLSSSSHKKRKNRNKPKRNRIVVK